MGLVIFLIVAALIIGVIASARIETAIRSTTDELHDRLDKARSSGEGQAVSQYAIGRVRCHKPLYVETPLWPDAEPHRPELTVDDHEAVDTGLVARTGETIWRLPEPMGFRK